MTVEQVNALIAAHSAISSAHHVKTPSGGGGNGAGGAAGLVQQLLTTRRQILTDQPFTVSQLTLPAATFGAGETWLLMGNVEIEMRSSAGSGDDFAAGVQLQENGSDIGERLTLQAQDRYRTSQLDLSGGGSNASSPVTIHLVHTFGNTPGDVSVEVDFTPNTNPQNRFVGDGSSLTAIRLGVPDSGIARWAQEGNTSLIPADKYRAPTSTARGAPFAITNSIIDNDSHTLSTLYAWTRSHVKRLIERTAVTRGYIGVYGSLTAATRGSVNLGDIVLRFNRYWIVHDETLARANGPLDAEPDGWRAIDGQYRGVATPTARFYDAGDHTVVNGTIYFCEVGGQYTAAQILTSAQWSGGPLVDQTARDAAADAAAHALATSNALAAHINAHPTGEGSNRTEVFAPFRPGSRPGAILIESTGYVINGNYTAYISPHYVAASGGFTTTVDDAQDFSNEAHIRRIVDGGDSAPITELPDSPTMDGLTGIYRDGNAISTVSSRPSSIINLHFVQNVGGSRFWNPDDRVARFPHGGAATPDFNEGHQWIAGLGILAVGNDKRIELITDGDQPGGTLRVTLGVAGGASVEHLVVPLVSDPNAYHSGLVSNIPDGQDLEFSITNNGNVRILHDGSTLRAIHTRRGAMRRGLVPLQQRVSELEDSGGVTRFALSTTADQYVDTGSSVRWDIPYPDGTDYLTFRNAYVVGYVTAPANWVGPSTLDGVNAWPMTPLNLAQLRSVQDDNFHCGCRFSRLRRQLFNWSYSTLRVWQRPSVTVGVSALR